MAAGTPAGCAAGHNINGPLPRISTSRGGGRGQGRGRASLVDLFGSILAAFKAEERPDWTQGDLPSSWDRKEHGAGEHLELDRVQVPPHPSVSKGSTVVQGVPCCGHKGSQRLLLWVRGVKDRATVRDRVVHLSLGTAQPAPPSHRGWA